MQTVPSLVGTGTAVAAASSGLVFGETTVPDHCFNSRPESHLTTSRTEHDQSRLRHRVSHTLPASRSGTSSGAPSIRAEGIQQHQSIPQTPVVSRPPLSRYQRPRTSQINSISTSASSSRVPNRRSSPFRPAESPIQPIAETPRTSLSSSGSWIRRLSIRRPSSQQGSTRSSIGPDSNSIAFSHGSTAPILFPTNPIASLSTPNKLVKRSPSIGTENRPGVSRSKSRSHLPTLRRPATSHQRSATLHAFPSVDIDTPAVSSRNSIEGGGQIPALLPSALEKSSASKSNGGWTSFFHSRTSSTSGRSVGAQSRFSRLKRVQIFGSDHRQRAHLVKPNMVSVTSPAGATDPEGQDEAGHSVQHPQQAAPPAEQVFSGNARRSISMTFTSAGNWVSRTSGSIRRPKRGSTHRSESHRHASDPGRSMGGLEDHRPTTAYEATGATNHHYATPPRTALGAVTDTVSDHPLPRTRSSPLTPLSNSANFEQTGSMAQGSATKQGPRQNQPSGSSTSSGALSNVRFQHYERSSTVDGSESELRDFTSGDDDDTDFKSDTIFDSLRTGTSGRVRAVDTPLDSMYDESPPSTGGNGKAKRLSIQEILGKEWDIDDKISEEDESLQTPVRLSLARSTATPRLAIAHEPRFSIESGNTAGEYGRFSIDEDFDDDWTTDGPINPLSPPSKGSSLNSRGVNPNVRLALANVSGNSIVESSTTDGHNERPLSNLFDWSETSLHEKPDAKGRVPRPNTSYANQDTDARGGRSTSRRGPAPTHVRSQSVPVVNDTPDEPKPTGSKYGTWGLGSKTISEDWDDDFEFGGSLESDQLSNEQHFAVPESIQAAQPSVRAHSGQIRELSLLVNDLQRLCRHGRDLDLLEGPYRSLWKEAEGIIALASPDDDSLEDDHQTNSTIDFDTFDASERLLDDDCDSTSLDKLDAALEGREPAMSKTAVVRDRPSPRRRSVFSPDDDIFGGSWPPSEDNFPSSRASRPRTPESRMNRSTDVNGVVRSVVEVMQQRSITESLLEGGSASKKMHFDTNSLRILVKRAGDLRDVLSDAVRRSDQLSQSPIRTPRHERHLESSPAFTKVFDDPGSSPPRHIVRSRGNTKVDDTSPENSPSSNIGRRLQLMTVK